MSPGQISIPTLTHCSCRGNISGLLQNLVFQLMPGCSSQNQGLDTSDFCVGAHGRCIFVNTGILFDLDVEVAELFLTWLLLYIYHTSL